MLASIAEREQFRSLSAAKIQKVLEFRTVCALKVQKAGGNASFDKVTGCVLYLSFVRRKSRNLLLAELLFQS